MSLEKTDTERLKFALKEGFAITPTSHDMPPREERRDQIFVITRVVYAEWNIFHRPMHISQICNEALRIIQNERKNGDWKHGIPSRRTLERSTNYAASKNWWRGSDDERPRIICLRPGMYAPNPIFFDPETQEKMRQILFRSGYCMT